MTYPQDCIPRSWLLTFAEDSNEVTARCYLHSNDLAPQGWYDKFDRTITVSAIQILDTRPQTSGTAAQDESARVTGRRPAIRFPKAAIRNWQLWVRKRHYDAVMLENSTFAFLHAKHRCFP
jgi:hypothetical protein